MADDTGSIVTVEGRVPPEDLGVTLPHEHTFIDVTEEWYQPPESAYERKLAEEPVSLDNLWYVRRNPLSNEDNGRLESLEEAVAELRRFHRAGGDAVVDVTPKGIGADPQRVRGVARETGLTFVHGTAYYTAATHPDRVSAAAVDDLAVEFVSDVREGIDDTDVRAGMIGEIGVSGHVRPAEETVLRAGARAAARTGAPLSVHPPGRAADEHQEGEYPSSRWGLDVLDIVEQEGLPADRVVLCHQDRTPLEFEPDALDYQRELAERGAYVEYDLWGTERYQDRYGIGWPSDRERIAAARALVEDGYHDNLLFSHDICTKIQLTRYGGFGYEHLPANVTDMLTTGGFDDETIHRILVENPRRMLTFDEPLA